MRMLRDELLQVARCQVITAHRPSIVLDSAKSRRMVGFAECQSFSWQGCMLDRISMYKPVMGVETVQRRLSLRQWS
jgi:hypothetical protein